MKNKKWKIAFFISSVLNLPLLFLAGYMLLGYSMLSKHDKDNALLLNEDLTYISDAIEMNAHTMDEFNRIFNDLGIKHSSDPCCNVIKLRMADVLFDDDGHFEKIEAYP